MSMIEKRLKELGIVLPEGPAPMANYVSVQQAGDLLFLSGAGPIQNGKPTCTGRLGENVTLEQGYDAARETALNLISMLKHAVGDLDKVKQIVKLTGYVASTNDFHQQPIVINGASDLFYEVFGEKGKHARVAIGTSVLPFQLPVEIEMIAQIKE